MVHARSKLKRIYCYRSFTRALDCLAILQTGGKHGSVVKLTIPLALTYNCSEIQRRNFAGPLVAKYRHI